MFKEVDETLDRATVAVPEGPEVAKMVALRLALKSVSEEQEVSDEKLSEAVDRMVELVGPTEDLRAFLEAVPHHDLGWASLAGARLSRAIQLRDDGKTRRAREMFAKVDETLDRAIAAAPEGPEVARMVALHLALKSIDEEQEVSDEELSVLPTNEL